MRVPAWRTLSAPKMSLFLPVALAASGCNDAAGPTAPRSLAMAGRHSARATTPRGFAEVPSRTSPTPSHASAKIFGSTG